MSQQEIQIPEGYEKVSAGEPADFAQYRCGKCKTVFVAAHHASYRMATGRTVTHCGEPAWWIRNVRKTEPIWVSVYEDPLTETKLEGKARLIEKTKTETDQLESWIVQFEGDEGKVFRWIKKGCKEVEA